MVSHGEHHQIVMRSWGLSQMFPCVLDYLYTCPHFNDITKVWTWKRTSGLTAPFGTGPYNKALFTLSSENYSLENCKWKRCVCGNHLTNLCT